MKLGKFDLEMDTKEMSDDYLEWKFHDLISDQVVANAVMAVLLKLEIERRRDEVLAQERHDMMMSLDENINFDNLKD